MTVDASISLVSKWFPRAECLAALRPRLEALALCVKQNEPDTLAYIVHVPLHDARVTSLPPVEPASILFFETYRNVDAFLQHVNGPTFKNFVAECGHMFLQSAGAPYTTVEFLDRAAGFVRPEVVEQDR